MLQRRRTRIVIVSYYLLVTVILAGFYYGGSWPRGGPGGNSYEAGTGHLRLLRPAGVYSASFRTTFAILYLAPIAIALSVNWIRKGK